MKTIVVFLALVAFACADKKPAVEVHGVPASPQYNAPPHVEHHTQQHAVQHQLAQAVPHHQDQYAPAAPPHNGDQGYYYYYYPVEEKPKEKDFLSKMMEKLYINKMMETMTDLFYQTARSDIIFPGATTFMLGAAAAAGSMLLFPVIGRSISSIMPAFNFETMRTAFTGFIERNFNVNVTSINSRNFDFTVDDVFFYVDRVLEAINKEY